MDHPNGNGAWERPDAPLGTLVFRAGLLSKEKLESALVEGQRSGRRLGEILLQKGWIEEKDLARLLAGQRGLSFVSLKGRGFDPEVARLLPERAARFHNALPVELEGDGVLVAIADPTDDAATTDIRGELGRDLELVVATATEIRAAIDQVYDAADRQAPPPPPVAASTLGGELGLRIAAPAGSAPEPVVSREPESAPFEPEPPRDPAPEPAAPRKEAAAMSPVPGSEVDSVATQSISIGEPVDPSPVLAQPSSVREAEDPAPAAVQPFSIRESESAPPVTEQPFSVHDPEAAPAAAAHPSSIREPDVDVAPPLAGQPASIGEREDPAPVAAQPFSVRAPESASPVAQQPISVLEPEVAPPVAIQPASILAGSEIAAPMMHPAAADEHAPPPGELGFLSVEPLHSAPEPDVPTAVGEAPVEPAPQPVVEATSAPTASGFAADGTAERPQTPLLLAGGASGEPAEPPREKPSAPVISLPAPDSAIERIPDGHAGVAVDAPAPSVPPRGLEPDREAAPDRPDEPGPAAEAHAAESERFRLILNLDEGDDVDVDEFATEAEAVAAAGTLIEGIANRGEWPRVGAFFLRPERIRSVEIRERQRYTGSEARARWAESFEVETPSPAGIR